VERFERNFNEENNYNRRTSTPVCPSRHQKADNIPLGGSIDSFSIESISAERLDVLSRFSEFRQLVRAYHGQKKNCQTWVNDYARLEKKFKQLEENSFRKLNTTYVRHLSFSCFFSSAIGNHP
jgi:hypothetical protein